METNDVCVELTDTEIDAAKRVVIDRATANAGRQHSMAYRNGAALGAIDTSTDGAAFHETQSVCVELAVAKHLGSVKPVGCSVWHAASKTYDATTHRKLSKTKWSTDVWVFAPEGSDIGEIVEQDWIHRPTQFADRNVILTVEAKKMNRKVSSRNGQVTNDLHAGNPPIHGGNIRLKDCDQNSILVTGQASEDFSTVILIGWVPLTADVFNEAEVMFYDRTGESSRQLFVDQLNPMSSLNTLFPV
jgi:hypothetical protein